MDMNTPNPYNQLSKQKVCYASARDKKQLSLRDIQ